MERYGHILYLSDLIVPNGEVWSNIVPPWTDSTNGEVWSNIAPQWPECTKWRGMVKYFTSMTWVHQMERYGQILYRSDLIVPNGEVWSNIVPQWTDSNQMERYGQILYLNDQSAPNGEVWSNIVPQWPECTKWRGMVTYCTLVTW